MIKIQNKTQKQVSTINLSYFLQFRFYFVQKNFDAF